LFKTGIDKTSVPVGVATFETNLTLTQMITRGNAINTDSKNIISMNISTYVNACHLYVTFENNKTLH
jgi:hypothetical protein